jgi:hypothetical protein
VLSVGLLTVVPVVCRWMSEGGGVQLRLVALAGGVGSWSTALCMAVVCGLVAVVLCLSVRGRRIGSVSSSGARCLMCL